MREGVRPAGEADLHQIVALYARVYPDRSGASLAPRAAYMHRILMQHPWRDDRFPSLVYSDQNGRLVGFLGVMPRPMLIRGRPISMAVSHHFMVAPESRATLAGVSLLKAFFAGRQELSICAPEEPVRKIWSALGGTSALLRSLHWTCPLRHAGYLALRLQQRRYLAPMAQAVRPGCRWLDAIAMRMRRPPLWLAEPATSTDDLDPTTLSTCIEAFSQDVALRPVYETQSLGWLLDILVDKKSWGMLRKRRVYKPQQGVLGHYLYYVQKGGVSEVLQVAARKGAMRDVLADLSHDAWTHGAVAVSGRFDPRYAREIANEDILGSTHFQYRDNWLMVHTREPEVQRIFDTEEAFLTRLEDEWWIPFHDWKRHEV